MAGHSCRLEGSDWGITGKARSQHLQKLVNEIGEKGGAVKLGWVKAHMGILGNEAAKRGYLWATTRSGCPEGV